jgi:trehalose 6-phosphate phosphatase
MISLLAAARLPRKALFLDIDGTLLDFAPTPGGVSVPPGLPARLRQLRDQLDGALAFVTGRAMRDVDALFGDDFAAAAEHGAFVRDGAGALHQLARPVNDMGRWQAEMAVLVAAMPGVTLEPKRLGFTVHFRKAPARAGVLHHALSRLVGTQAEILPANMAWEVRPPQAGKDRALGWFMGRAPFAGRLPVFIGDDVTDEPAIGAAYEYGGVGLHVGHDFAGGPAAVRAWLTSLVRDTREG